MKTIDLTHPIEEGMPVYPGKTCFSKIVTAHYEEGYCSHDIQMTTGIGTHMDAPAHFDPKGYTIDQVSLSQCIGPAFVIHLSKTVNEDCDYAISGDDLESWETDNGQIPKDAIVLFHTGWDRYYGKEMYFKQDSDGVCHSPGLSKEVASLLVKRGVKAVGIDAMSLDIGASKDFPSHVVMLNAGLVLIENLANLGDLPPKGANAWILPMKLKEGPEAPVRAMAQF